MKRLIHNSSGFTLIELIVAFTIMSILSVVGVASFVDYSRSQAILADRQKLVTVLNTAKVNASSQVKQIYCSNSDIPAKVLNGYSVSLDTTNGSYTLNIECITIGATPQLSIANPIDYNLSKNISFGATNVVKIFYPLFTGKTVLYSDTFGAVLPSGTKGTITLSGNTKTTIITIDQNGIIK